MSQQQQNTIEELYARVHGWVQGVGFRYFVIEQAGSLGLRGYTRNGSDGSVEVIAQGPRLALESLLGSLRKGPPAADVRDVQVQWRQPTEHIKGFHIRY